VASSARGYSGAEIEASIQAAMYAAFSSRSTLTTQSLVQALQATVPLSTTRAEEIEALRDWAGKRAVRASTSDAKLEGP
jgi:SpoVK/Ycf46/Vps4 family AAA+-type ATPase